MSFLNVMFLWALPLMALPVIIHLFHRRRRTVIQWGAMQFLAAAMTQRKRIWRVMDIILMLLRILAIAAIIFALAQPSVKSNLVGTAGARDVILILDCSLSMAQSEGGQSFFDKQVRRAEDILDTLGEGDYARLLLARQAPEWISPLATPVTGKLRSDLLARLAQMEPTLGAADRLRAIQDALDAPPADPGASRLIILLTDDQAVGWRTGEEQVWKGLGERIAKSPLAVNLNIIPAGAPGRMIDNLSIDTLSAPRSNAAPGELLLFTAQVRNCGDKPSPSAQLTWKEGEEIKGSSQLAPLEPGQTTEITLEHGFPKPGIFGLTCGIDRPDDLPLDNTARCVVEVVQRVPILIVDGTPSADPLQGESGFLLAALGHVATGAGESATSVFETRVIAPSALTTEKLEGYRVVVLANAGDLPQPVVAALHAYAVAGGGIWIAPGDRTDPKAFNETFFDQGRGLSPLAFGETKGDAANHDEFELVQPPMKLHPATHLLMDTQRLDVDKARVYQRHTFRMGVADQDVSILLFGASGDPLVVERSLGRGRVIVQTFPLGLDWSNLPLCQSFVVMAHEYLWYIAEPSLTRWNLKPGEELAARFTLSGLEDQADVTAPAGARFKVFADAAQGAALFRFGHTSLPGDYQMALQQISGEPLAVPFEVARPPEESDLKPISDADRKMIGEAAGLNFTDKALDIRHVGTQPAKGRPVTTHILLALAAAIAFETLLAAFLTVRRSATSLTPERA